MFLNEQTSGPNYQMRHTSPKARADSRIMLHLEMFLFWRGGNAFTS
jgi:hypothetical protein